MKLGDERKEGEGRGGKGRERGDRESEGKTVRKVCGVLKGNENLIKRIK